MGCLACKGGGGVGKGRAHIVHFSLVAAHEGFSELSSPVLKHGHVLAEFGVLDDFSKKLTHSSESS